MEVTKNPFKVMRMMGHTSLSTAKRYQHHDIAEVASLWMQEMNRGTIYDTVHRWRLYSAP